VELFTAILFAGLAIQGYQGLGLIVPVIVLSLLVAIFAYDIRHKIVPDALVYTFIALSFISLFFSLETMSFSYPTLSAFFAGPVLFVPFFALWFFSKGEWMGLGDGKLILGIGWFLGLAKGVSAVALSFWIALAVIGVLLLLQRINGGKIFGLHLHRKTEIPFTPFLIIGYLIVFFCNFNLAAFIL
jgi:prepilin signal peptidase PulO-like enzyme (type II secretory pathway)